MSERKIYKSLLIGCIFAILLAGFFWWWQRYTHTTTVTFFDVGSGDAILITQGSNQILIDGGRSGKVLLARLGRQLPFWDRTIEVVIATHPDADHIGGFTMLMEAYTTPLFLFTGAESDTETFALLKHSLAAHRTESVEIFRGGKIQFPLGGELVIEYPLTALSQTAEETNVGSLVARFTFGETDILFTGDLPNEEQKIPDIRPADILKVAHHGSKYSTSTTFLEALQPKEAVISVGKNSYGHPSPDVLERLNVRNILVRRTDIQGDVVYRCTYERGRCFYVK